MYQALYRKYRPKNFDDVVGQKYVIQTIKNSIDSNKISHAYMFFGPRGIGKTTIAKILARSINCLNPNNGNPCEECVNCKNSVEKECVDIIEIDAASNNGVDEIREIKSKVNLVPAELKYKVYIIDEVHMLTPGAFNALLKTLEEPPKHVVFILATTDPQKVSDTIISRCQCFSFKRISDKDNTDRLRKIAATENIDIDDDVLNQIAIYSDGGLRDSLGMLDKLSSYKSGKIVMQDFLDMNDMISKKELDDLYNSIIDLNTKNLILILNKFNDNGKNIVEIANQFLIYLKDLLIDYYLDKNSELNFEMTNKILNLINEKMFDIKKSSKPFIFMEILLLDCINSNKNISREIIEVSENTLGNKKNVLNDAKIPEKNVTNKNSIKYNEDNSKKDEEKFDFFEKKSINHKDENINYDSLYNLMHIRVNNTLAGASKEEKQNDSLLISTLNDYIFDQKIGYIASEILNGKLRASSNDSFILSYEYKSVVDQNLKKLSTIMDVYSTVTKSNKKIAFITDEEWEKEKNKYIEFTKLGNKYKIEEEPVIDNNLDNVDIQESSFDIFGDIVEIN